MTPAKPWAEMTWQEKREERFKNWLAAPGVKFVSAEAEKLHKERVTRFIKAIKMEEPDRVPAMLPVGSFPAYYAGTTFYNEFHVTDLLIENGRCRGVVAYDLATGELHTFHAKAVILAAGGYGRVFKITSNALTLTGDLMSIYYRKGLPLEDMEFYQFHPTGLAGLGILLTEGARAEGGILRNADGERFMERYAPTIKDLAPRDIVARSMANEVREGRGCGPNKDYVLLDLTHLEPAHIDAKLPDITEFARTYLGVEPYTEPVPVYPTAHYAMGGVPTTITGQVLRDNTTTVPGLYAAGEVACVSVHGANRLGTN